MQAESQGPGRARRRWAPAPPVVALGLTGGRGRRDPQVARIPDKDQNAISSARVSPSAPLSPSSLCPPAPVCILPLHHPVALFSSLLVTVCRPSPGLSFSSTPPRSFANFDFETKRRSLSLIDISPRARISSRPSTDRSPNQASKPARLTQPSTDYSSQRPCHPIINHRPANPSPTRQTHISISCKARLDCPLSSCLCVCVCASTSRSCRDCGQQVSRGFPSGSLGVAGSQRLSFLQGPTIYCAASTVLPKPHTTFRPIFSSPRQRVTCIFCKALSSNTPNSAGRLRNLSRGADNLLRRRRKGQLPVSDHWFHHSFTI